MHRIVNTSLSAIRASSLRSDSCELGESPDARESADRVARIGTSNFRLFWAGRGPFGPVGFANPTVGRVII